MIYTQPKLDALGDAILEVVRQMQMGIMTLPEFVEAVGTLRVSHTEMTDLLCPFTGLRF